MSTWNRQKTVVFNLAIIEVKKVIVPFFVKVVQTVVAHACDSSGTPCHGAAPQGEDGSRTVPGAKNNLAPRCIPRSQIKPFFQLEKNTLCDIFRLWKTYLNKDKI